MEKYVIKPSLKFFAVYEINGEQKETITDENNSDENGNSLKILQELDGLKLTSTREVTYKVNYMGNEMPITEKSTEEIMLSKGTKLVYVQNRGYILPEYGICTVKQAIDDLKVLEEE